MHNFAEEFRLALGLILTGDSDLWEIVLLSLKVSLLAVLIVGSCSQQPPTVADGSTAAASTETAVAVALDSERLERVFTGSIRRMATYVMEDPRNIRWVIDATGNSWTSRMSTKSAISR